LLETFFKSNNLGADIAMLRIEGGIDGSFTSKLSAEIETLLERDKAPNLVIDLGLVASIGYSLLDLLSDTARRLDGRDRILVVITDHPAVRQILKMRGFDHVFPVEEPLPSVFAGGQAEELELDD
jgi:anti-anti-sigma factor